MFQFDFSELTMIFLLVTTLYRGNFYVGGHESMHRYYAGKQEAIDVKKF